MNKYCDNLEYSKYVAFDTLIIELNIIKLIPFELILFNIIFHRF